jgi:NAD(P)-dependent dehydrogenase (short-subunit alcohol dehydrogenase family)
MSIAVVTGGAGDIGREISLALGKAGYSIAIADLSEEKCAAFAAELSAAGIEAFAAPVDITDRASVAEMAKGVLARGAVGAVINNAGVAFAPDFETTDEDSWVAALDVNLNGAYFVSRQFLPGMQAARKGVIINVSSGNGILYAGAPAYSVAKAGLIHFTRMLAVEYGPDNIRALSIVPGSVRTQAWAHRAAINPNIFDEIRQWYPLGRIVEAREVASVVAFAVSDAASAMSGSSLVVDCGALAGNTIMSKQMTRGDRT